MDIFDFYKTCGIDMSCHNGGQFYALKRSDALEMVELLREEGVTIHSIDVLHRNISGLFDYRNERGDRICWDFDSENIPDGERYGVSKMRIEALESENVAFLFSDEKSYKAWKKNHQRMSA
ncbi:MULTISPECIES: hypothetical protein [unclassified Sulfuricurvum]|uniref:hypothetical protein n=1 Tax=unclassified Sulfuricurvum TaxID=2632390 RepID=UPI00029963A2|nr:MULTISPECIES: hypothetical protein [unclassified Sulfuricurvum]AFV97060.1 hypothetical protein B649_03730 [Candidatus Sulfuricurvum sp. RIFRC-1]HBM35330.1 hypothetical protein [Sulfuricurvum sp.]